MSDQPGAEREERRRGVPVLLPPWLGGNNILKHAEEAGLKATAVDASAFRWRIQTRESYEGRAPRLVSLDELAGPSQAPRWQVLRAVAEPGVAAPLSRQQLLAERDRILAERPGDFTAVAAALKVVVSAIDQPALADVARKVSSPFRSRWPAQLAAFPQLDVRFIRFSLVLTATTWILSSHTRFSSRSHIPDGTAR